MKIKKLSVKNFRSLKDLEIEFNEDITCIVGENDAGKTSILDCIRAFSDSETLYKIDPDDFYKNGDYTEEEIVIKLELSNGVEIGKIYQKEKPNNPSVSTYYEKEYLDREIREIKEFFEEKEIIDKQINQLENDDYINFIERLKRLSKNLGETFRINSKVETIISNIENKINENEENNKIKIERGFTISVYYLDGKNIDNIENTIEKLFFSDIKTKIWQETVDIKEEKIPLKDLLDRKIENSLREREKDLSPLEEKLKNYLNKENLKIHVEKNYTNPSLNVSFKVLLKDEYGNAINTQKKGDGTKRRITMALLEEKFKEKINENEIKIFIFDEPDTHLHVKAQRDLLKLFKNYGIDKQIILTTHSPFIINSLKPTQIKFVRLDENLSKVEHFKSENSLEIDKILKEDLGIENILLFFARKILIVEGISEVNFFETLYLKKYGNTPYGDFIKILSANSINNFPQAIELITSVMNFPLKDIYILADNDVRTNTSHKTYNKIHKFVEKGLPENNVFYIGNKEFEDSFSCEDLYNILHDILNKKDCSIEDIEKLKSDSAKFSKDFCDKYQVDKVEELPKALAEYFSKEDNFEKLPQVIKEILNKLRES
ncbi:AAA family ATPase [Persephonella atlantica]|uniref:AAA family ATPase n=1 Tax=Persephonella atlantica TaxID=2699429 RepID=A0ABS1GJ29_9AQUI|nr:AAA family ATPase [Persephonella atlantica]MBK3332932.1 AAA family ATPase [Persephonella atlantica]